MLTVYIIYYVYYITMAQTIFCIEYIERVYDISALLYKFLFDIDNNMIMVDTKLNGQK